MGRIPPEFVIDETPAALPPPAQISQIRDQMVALIKSRAELAEKLADQEQQAKREKRRLFLDLLGVADAFDRIFRDLDLTQLNEIAQNVMGSFQATSILLENILDRQDVFPIDGLEGQAFDPRLQQGIGIEHQPGSRDGIVLEVREKGYWWQDQVLRRAKVIVSGKP